MYHSSSGGNGSASDGSGSGSAGAFSSGGRLGFACIESVIRLLSGCRERAINPMMIPTANNKPPAPIAIVHRHREECAPACPTTAGTLGCDAGAGLAGLAVAGSGAAAGAGLAAPAVASGVETATGAGVGAGVGAGAGAGGGSGGGVGLGLKFGFGFGFGFGFAGGAATTAGGAGSGFGAAAVIGVLATLGGATGATGAGAWAGSAGVVSLSISATFVLDLVPTMIMAATGWTTGPDTGAATGAGWTTGGAGRNGDCGNLGKFKGMVRFTEQPIYSPRLARRTMIKGLAESLLLAAALAMISFTPLSYGVPDNTLSPSQKINTVSRSELLTIRPNNGWIGARLA